MSVLLLRLAGSMQSWGVQSRFTVRDTGLEPSKSGVVGLLCAALGRHREEPVADLASLTMGVRVDQEGTMARDYHTAGKGGILKADGKVERRNLVVSNRYYLADARFLVGLEGGDFDLLEGLHAALRNPHWPLYLGRKAFVPGEPVWLPDGVRLGEGLVGALEEYPWLGCNPDKRPDQVRAVLEDPVNGPEVRPDQPLSFAERRFAPRRVSTTFLPGPPLRKEVDPCTSPG
jgi:CRISPR system Cascade subunit CasD